MQKKIVAAAAMSLITSASYAQSSVTLSGLIDAGVSYVSNQNGHSNFKFDDGIAVPNLLIFTGSEDLGGGTHAIFDLRNQFSLGTGSFMPGQSLFSRTAFVGLDNASYGRLTLGNQYDFMTDSLFFGMNDAAIFTGGLYGFRNGPFAGLALPNNPTGAFDWDRMAGERVTNSVKYESPSFNGFSAGAMYGFGGVAGSIGSNNATSFGLNYAGKQFGANAAYTNVKSDVAGAQVSVRNWGVGAHAKFGAFTANALFTTVHNSLNGASIWEAQAGGLYNVLPDLAVGASYMYMKGNDVLENQHAHQIAAQVSYLLSKRTTVYASGIYQRAASGGQALINGVFDGASSSPTQAIARVGLETKF
ncbi:porin [Paraburkholderia sp. HD33-4]|uniref:porin n=1 Tax=Paraburkholderia sp. HD33-4 TaxID=2883242 RepID=UPI001F433A42|nr:porin [Paraburkholderia sp. HD33-4]